MPLDLTTILPNVGQSLNGTGFLFGAGTSREAGYPMMSELTHQVMSALSPTERSLIDGVLTAAATAYDDAKATPNIEELSDFVIAHAINSGDPKLLVLETRLRELIVEKIVAVANPVLDNHYRFFEALKRRAFGLPCTVWIFTTNYDLLFETAAAQRGITVENGFCGATERYFNPAQFRNVSGTVAGGTFAPNCNLTVKLLKLHGSISWFEDTPKFYERHPSALAGKARRVMILPRRRKAMDALTPPYDSLFAQASKVMGSECKYLVSCGYSFGDEHINQQLLMPGLQSNRCRLFALCQQEPAGLAEFKVLPTVRAGFSSHLLIDGKAIDDTTDFWMFSRFVTLFL